MKLAARPGSALQGVAAIGGDKSCSHRALILAAMAGGTSRIVNLAPGEDVAATLGALRALGAQIAIEGQDVVVTGGAWHSPQGPLDCGNSGTSARLLLGAIAGMPEVRATLTGDASLSRRPMGRLVAPLRKAGAAITGGDTLPLAVEGRRLGAIDHLNAPASAQVKTALLLAGLGGEAPVRIVEPLPSRDHGEIMLARFGAEVVVDDRPEGWAVSLGRRRALAPTDIAIAADPSSAAFPLVAALLVPGSRVRVEGMLLNPLRTGLFEALERMGAAIEMANERLLAGELVADVTASHSRLSASAFPTAAVPAMIDEIPLLAVACAMASGESQIEGLGELRHKESDRLAALAEGLAACGVEVGIDGDALRIAGRGRVRGGHVKACGDHRIAMAFLTLGLASDPGVEIDDGHSIATSFPGFVAIMRALGANIE